MTCPGCSANDRQELLGRMGRVRWRRCRYCGWLYPNPDPCFDCDHESAETCASCPENDS